VLQALSSVRGSTRVESREPEKAYRTIEKYTLNLTDLARREKIDPVIGRDEEIRRVMQVLSRRTKNNPVLIGEAGVGKSAIVEGLAQRIAGNDVPDNLRNKELIALDLAGLLAGAKFRGEFEERLKALLQEIDRSADRYILFIDELHTLVGAGASEGSLDASNMLKPALARGKLRTIGATTTKEYRQHIEKDSALERRFQPIIVGEPSEEDALAMLRGIKDKYELHHGVRITDDALAAAVKLSKRYIADRFLPDKAIDLIDEAASLRRIEINSLPADIDQLERSVRRLEIERRALEKETDTHAKERLRAIVVELADMKERSRQQTLRWKTERDLIVGIREHKKTIDVLKSEAEVAEREGRLDRVAEIRYGDIPDLEKRILEESAKLGKFQQSGFILREEVTQEDVAAAVAKWTGIPVAKMLESEWGKLAQLETVLTRRVVGQKEAVETVARAVRRSRAGLSEEGRPIGSFLFLGMTGVGKTELAKALAQALFDDEKALIRLDMSEYMEAHATAKFIGSPPGYVGYDEGGQLTETVRRRPYSVLLFDEIEKAHPDVLNSLLQVLDDGRLTDAKGRTVNFKNTVIIMTSNVGSQVLSRHVSELGFRKTTGRTAEEANERENREKVLGILRETFKPEFLNRIDEIIVFHPLSETMIGTIAEMQLRRIAVRLAEKGLTLSVTDEAKRLLAKKGFDPVYGARPLKRVLQTCVLDPLAQTLLGKTFDGEHTVRIDAQNEEIMLDVD
jgi:ATP-dependent Clp protease ATP-binding subunit ClpB